MDVAESKLGVVVDTLEQDLGSIVKTLGEAAVANVLNVGDIWSVDELLEISQIVCLGIGVDKLSIQKILLQVLACHLKEGNDLSVNLCLVRLGTHPHVFTGIFSTNETQNSISSHLLLQLRITKLRPNRLLVNLICEGLGTIKILHVVNKDSHSKNLHFNLLLLIGGVFRLGKLDVNGESFLVKHVTFRNANKSNVLGIEVVQLVDVGGDLSVVSTDGSEDKQVLKILVVRKVRSLQDDSFKKNDEFTGKISSHESLNSTGNLIGGFTLGKCPFHHLINKLPTLGLLLSVNVTFLAFFLSENLRPQLQILSLNEVSGKITEQTMSETDLDKLIVTFSSTLLVSNECKGRIQTLAEGTEDLGFVEHVVGQEGLGVLVHLNVNLTQRVVSSRLSTSSGNTCLEPGLKHTKTVPHFGNLHHFLHWACSAYSHQNALCKVLIGSEIKQLSNNLGSFRGRDLGNVNLNILKKTVQVQVLRKLINKVVTVTDMDERTGIRKLGILKVLLHLLGFVNVGITADTLGLLELSQHTRTLDVLEVHNGILRKVHNRTEVVVETFGGLGIFKHLDKLLGTKFIIVLLGNLNANLHVRWTTRHHILEQSNALFTIQLSKVGDNEFGVHLVAVFEDTFDVIDITVVLGSTLPHTSTLAKLSNVGTIVVGENSILHDGIGDLGSTTNEVDFKKLCLEVGVFLLVVLECLKKEGGSLLHTIAGQESLGGGLNINERTTISTNETLGKVQRSLRIAEQQLTQHTGVIHGVSHASRVWNNLVILSPLHKALNGLGMSLTPQIHTQSHGSIMRHDQISKCLGTMQLIILKPLLHQLRTALLQHRLGQFDTLLLIKLSMFQQCREILKDGLGGTRFRGDLLESCNGLWSTKCRSRRCHKLCRLLNLSCTHQRFKLLSVKMFCTGQTQPSSNLDSQIIITKCVHNVRDQVRPIQTNTVHPSSPNSNTKHRSSTRLSTRHKHSLLSYPSPKHSLPRMNIKHVHKPSLGQQKRHIILGINHK
mmetsp:Transcript_25810/g.40097  ORF Transcript_25810/g.40097 Transcript_25810/m.40097 type:complete len:1000 (+) Transcript_25810:1485-4484(+)